VPDPKREILDTNGFVVSIVIGNASADVWEFVVPESVNSDRDLNLCEPAETALPVHSQSPVVEFAVVLQ
jgi:hypothetical protein